MRARLTAATTTAVSVLIAPVLAPALAAPAAPAPQVVDQAGDANGSGTVLVGGAAAPVGNQAYADVLSVLWQRTVATTKVNGKSVTGPAFTVTMTLSAPPVAPAGTAVVYRALGRPGDGLFLGPVYYTSKSSDPGIPQSALRDNLTGVTRLTPIDLPVIKDSTITWTVPLRVMPKEQKPAGTLKDLYVEINEIEDFRGAQVPAGVPVYGGAYGLGAGQLDGALSTATFVLP